MENPLLLEVARFGASFGNVGGVFTQEVVLGDKGHTSNNMIELLEALFFGGGGGFQKKPSPA